MAQPETAPGSARHGRWQRLQQGLAFVDNRSSPGILILIPLPSGPFGPAVALPVAAIAVVCPIRARAILARPLFTGTILTGTILTNALITGTIFPRPVISAAAVTRAVIATACIAGTLVTGTVVAGALIAGALIAGTVVAGTVIAIVGAVIVALDAIHLAVQAIVVIAFAAAAVFGLAITVIAKHTEIMFGVLQIIFCRDTIAGLLGITRQGAIFFQQLGGVAALAVVQPGTIIVATSHLLRARTRIAATSPPPLLVVPDQDRRPRCLAIFRPLLGEIVPLGAVRTPGANLTHPRPDLPLAGVPGWRSG